MTRADFLLWWAPFLTGGAVVAIGIAAAALIWRRELIDFLAGLDRRLARFDAHLRRPDPPALPPPTRQTSNVRVLHPERHR